MNNQEFNNLIQSLEEIPEKYLRGAREEFISDMSRIRSECQQVERRNRRVMNNIRSNAPEELWKRVVNRQFEELEPIKADTAALKYSYDPEKGFVVEQISAKNLYKFPEKKKRTWREFFGELFYGKDNYAHMLESRRQEALFRNE
jgi:hypothetical protein